jgi:hypothetical protein
MMASMGDEPHPEPTPFCRVGDIVELTTSGTTNPWPGEVEERFEAGARYRAVDLIGWGWDLEKVSGAGPDYLRIINSDMPRYVTVVGRFRD